jgi:hypothetical protein
MSIASGWLWNTIFLAAQVSSTSSTESKDVWESLQGSIDRAARNSGSVKLAAGVYLVSRPIVVPSGITVVGAGMDRTTIRNIGRFPGPLVQFGMKGAVRNVTLSDFCVEVKDNDLKGTNCIQGDQADDVRITRVKVRGSKYEGLVGGAHARRWTVTDCEAEECGNGGSAYQLSTAGINVASREVLLKNCKTRRCGQGFEFGNLNVTLEGCSATEPGPGTPSLAFNCGSAVVGVHKVKVVKCTSEGYASALVVGNGIGRMSALTVEACTFTDGSITFSGGKPKNSVPTPDQGPDVSGSFIRDCTVRWTKPSEHTAAAMLYNTGIAKDGKVLGREPLTVERLKVKFAAKPTGTVSQPIMGVAGQVSAKVVFRNCMVEGLDEPPTRGDGAVFGVLENQLPADIGNIRFIDCKATTSTGAKRPFVVKNVPNPNLKTAKKK